MNNNLNKYCQITNNCDNSVGIRSTLTDEQPNYESDFPSD